MDTSASMYVLLRPVWVEAMTLDNLSCMLASFLICASCPTNTIVAFVAFGGDSSMIGVDGGGIGVDGGGLLIAVVDCSCVAGGRLMKWYAPHALRS